MEFLRKGILKLSDKVGLVGRSVKGSVYLDGTFSNQTGHFQPRRVIRQGQLVEDTLSKPASKVSLQAIIPDSAQQRAVSEGLLDHPATQVNMPRSYQHEYTRSRPISEVKHVWARLVLR